MTARKKMEAERSRIVASLAGSLVDGGGGYAISTAFAPAARRPFLGPWTVAEHLVDGLPFAEAHARTVLHGRKLLEPAYEAAYDFSELICVKKVELRGLLESEGGPVSYLFRMAVSLLWYPEPRALRVTPVLGYQASYIGGEPVALRELEGSAKGLGIAFRLDGGDLVLEEGGDVKRLRRP